MGFRNLIVQSEVIEQRFGAVVLPHHDQQSSDDQNPTEHMLPSNMLLLNLILLIDVTFSTPTGVYAHKWVNEGMEIDRHRPPRDSAGNTLRDRARTVSRLCLRGK